MRCVFEGEKNSQHFKQMPTLNGGYTSDSLEVVNQAVGKSGSIEERMCVTLPLMA
jgi:hypothetical protein